MPRRALTTFLLALEFLTIVRLRRRAEAEPRDLGASLVWFPLVGLLIGLALAGADWLLHEKVYQASFFPEPMAVAIVILFGVVLTGAIHLDGLADTADGLFGGRTRERRLEIMRDSRIGTFGVIAILFAVLFIYLSLASMYENRRLALILVPAFARYAMVLAVVLFPYARPSGLGKAFHDYASPLALIGSTVIIAAIAYGVGVWSWDTEAGVAYVFVVVATMLVTAAAGFFVSRRLGGLTGDVYGAIGVLVEVLLFLAFRGDPYAILRSGLHPY